MRKRLAGITGVGSISIALAVLLFAPFLLLAQPPPSPPLRVQDSSGTPTGRPRVLQFTGCTVTYAGSVVTISSCGGANPAGSGSEIQARSSATTLQAVTGSSTTSGGIALIEQTAANVPLSITGASSQSGDMIDVTANAGSAGGLFKVTSAGAGVFASTLTATRALMPRGSAGAPSLAMSDNGLNGFYAPSNVTGAYVDGFGAIDWYITGSQELLRSGGARCWTSDVNNANANSPDTCIARGNAKVTQFQDAAGHASAWQAGDANGTTRPTCASGYRGTYWHVYGGAGVADTVAVCCKNVSDAYVWSTAFLSSGTCS